MIRLPVTGIDISQNDVAYHISQIDIYIGLLRQGFKKHEVLQYFAKLAEERKARNGFIMNSPPPSAYTLETSAQHHWQKEVVEDEADTATQVKAGKAVSVQDEVLNVAQLPHAPRQSSLLKFSKMVSSDSSMEETPLPVPFSPRSQITFRPRSQTYSYEQSERDSEDLVSHEATEMPILEHLSLYETPVPDSIDSNRTTIRVVSNLRPEAESFTPSNVRQSPFEGDSSSPESDVRSFPSSPPIAAQRLIPEESSPVLPPNPVTPSRQIRGTAASQTRSRHAFLDGAFTIYNDSVSRELQPQTPADLQRQPFSSIFNPAYTAPPGLLRSPVSQARDITDLSPTAHAIQIRERRRREYERSTRLNQQSTRPRRTRDGSILVEPAFDIVRDGDLWRDELEADSVGEENFEDYDSHGSTGRHMRAVSGNRRA